MSDCSFRSYRVSPLQPAVFDIHFSAPTPPLAFRVFDKILLFRWSLYPFAMIMTFRLSHSSMFHLILPSVTFPIFFFSDCVYRFYSLPLPFAFYGHLFASHLLWHRYCYLSRTLVSFHSFSLFFFSFHFFRWSLAILPPYLPITLPTAY